MAVTSTASTAVSSQQPRIARGAEVITRSQTYTQAYAVSPTLSSGDVIIFSDLKIPHGSLITRIEVIGRVQFDSTSVQILEAGIHGGTADLFGSATASGTFARLDFVNGAVLPYRVSVSDDATTRFVTPMLRADGNPASPTASYTLTMMVSYIQDT